MYYNTTEELEQIHNNLLSGKLKAIAWGAGSMFDDSINSCPYRISYILDNDTAKHYQHHLSRFPVQPPRLLPQDEDPKDVIILIFSSFLTEIGNQINALGPYKFLPYSALYGTEERVAKEKKQRALVNEAKELYKDNPNPKKENAIIIQGPFNEPQHLNTLQYFKTVFPNCHLIASTWNTLPPTTQSKIKELADHALFNTPPEIPSFQNRNYQITSTHNALQLAKKLGAPLSLKARCDTTLLNPQLFQLAHDFWQKFPPSPHILQHGAKSQILIPETYSRLHLPCHPSDIIQLGHTDDLLKVWSVPLDSRQFSMADKEWIHASLHDLGFNGIPAESYIALHYAKHLDLLPNNPTIQDSWDFLKNAFIILNNDDIGLFWHKHPKIAHEEISSPHRACINHHTWLNLNTQKPIDIHNTPWTPKPISTIPELTDP